MAAVSNEPAKVPSAVVNSHSGKIVFCATAATQTGSGTVFYNYFKRTKTAVESYGKDGSG
jgi:hypothetical protein